MKTTSIAIVSLLGLFATVTATDFCSANLCSGQPHIGCQNKGTFDARCPPGQTEMVTMTNSIKAIIVDSHNRKRDTIAGGRLSGFKAATRMATTRWSDELALLASYNAKTCKFDHDKCHNTVEFKYSGQNIAKFWWSGGSYSDEEMIKARIDSWWAEYTDTNMSQLDKYPRSTSKQIGHFTVMTADKNVAVGCAAIKFPDNKMSSLTLVCNYASTNILDRPLYSSGGTATQCTTGRNPQYPALCSLSEVYNVNAI